MAKIPPQMQDQIMKLQQLQQRDPMPPPQPIPEFDQDADALKFLREQIMSELLNTATTFKDDLTFSTPYQRVLVLSQLFDHLVLVGLKAVADLDRIWLR